MNIINATSVRSCGLQYNDVEVGILDRVSKQSILLDGALGRVTRVALQMMEVFHHVVGSAVQPDWPSQY